MIMSTDRCQSFRCQGLCIPSLSWYVWRSFCVIHRGKLLVPTLFCGAEQVLHACLICGIYFHPPVENINVVPSPPGMNFDNYLMIDHCQSFSLSRSVYSLVVLVSLI